MSEYTIECHDCAAGDESHRAECLVALFDDLDAEPGRPILFDSAEVRALRALRDGGLLPSATRMPIPLRDTGS